MAWDVLAPIRCVLNAALSSLHTVDVRELHKILEAAVRACACEENEVYCISTFLQIFTMKQIITINNSKSFWVHIVGLSNFSDI